MDSKADLVGVQQGLFQQVLGQAEEQWKILIFDGFNRDIVSSQLKMRDLREFNVTLYFGLHEPREALPDVTAIYLVEPTSSNVTAIVQDCTEGLYSQMLIHFSSEPSQKLLASFANDIVKRAPQTISRIKQVQYSSLGLQCVDKSMVIAPDNAAMVNLMVNLRCKPVFFHTSVDSEKVYLLSERMEKSTENFADSAVVIMLQRESDLLPVLAHGITYAGLLESIMGVSPGGHSLVEPKATIDLKDPIWLHQKHQTIDQLDLNREFSAIKQKLLAHNLRGEEAQTLGEASKRIEGHLSNASLLMKQATARKLNKFHEVEDELHEKGKLAKETRLLLRELLEDPTLELEDKIRVMCVFVLTADSLKDVEEFEACCAQLNHPLYQKLKQARVKEGGGRALLKHLALSLWKNIVSSRKNYWAGHVVRKLREGNYAHEVMTELGLMRHREGRLERVAHTVVYISGGVCFNEEADLLKVDSDIIYVGDKFITAKELFSLR